MLDRNRFHELRRSIQQLTHLRFRSATGLAWVEGTRSLVRAVDHHRKIHTVVVCDRLLRPALGQMLVKRLRRQGVPVAKVSPEQFRQVSRTPRASGIGILMHQHWTTLDQLYIPERICLVAVSRMRSVGNLGTMIRTAEAAGASGVIVLDPRTDPFDPGVLRSSMGSVVSTPLVRASLPALRTWAEQHDIRLVATSPAGQQLYSAELPPRAVILLGEERGGLTETELTACGNSLWAFPWCQESTQSTSPLLLEWFCSNSADNSLCVKLILV